MAELTRDEVIRMAREAGFLAQVDAVYVSDVNIINLLKDFAALVAAHEREECAKTVEAMIHGNVKTCAAAIRARGDK